jgi:hypothetical protein
VHKKILQEFPLIYLSRRNNKLRPRSLSMRELRWNLQKEENVNLRKLPPMIQAQALIKTKERLQPQIKREL